MLNDLLEALKKGMQERNIRLDAVSGLLVEAKRLNYTVLKVPENFEEIENALEEDSVFDTLWTLRGYLVTYTHLTLQRDWYYVVDTIDAATGYPIDATSTVNRDSKEEYYRQHYPSPKEYVNQQPPSYVQRDTGASLFRANDWVVVLWLLSWVDARFVETLKASAPPATKPVS